MRMVSNTEPLITIFKGRIIIFSLKDLVLRCKFNRKLDAEEATLARNRALRVSRNDSRIAGTYARHADVSLKFQ